MILGRVLGNVVSTVKHPGLHGRAVFSVQPVDPTGTADGDTFLAIDHAQSGPGDLVLVLCEGNGIRQVLGDSRSPVRRLIVGVVDAVDCQASPPRDPAPAARGRKSNAKTQARRST